MDEGADVDFASHRALAELDRVVEGVRTEISARRNTTNPAAVTQRRRVGTAALLSEAAAIARGGHRR
jgi:hypothetical protein